MNQEVKRLKKKHTVYTITQIVAIILAEMSIISYEAKTNQLIMFMDMYYGNNTALNQIAPRLDFACLAMNTVCIVMGITWFSIDQVYKTLMSKLENDEPFIASDLRRSKYFEAIFASWKNYP